jgi:hypothetical protein
VVTFLSQCRERIDFIEHQIDELEEEREKLVELLSTYSELYKTSSNPFLSPPPAHLKGFKSGVIVEPAFAVPNPAPDAAQFEPVSPPVRRVPDASRIPPPAPLRIAQPTPPPAPMQHPLHHPVTVVHKLLKDGKRRHIRELLNYLELRGLKLNSSNPAGLLSSLLSKDDRFDASRKDGWGLKDTEE